MSTPIALTLSLFSIQPHIMPFDMNIATFRMSLAVIASMFFVVWVILAHWEDIRLRALARYLLTKLDGKGQPHDAGDEHRYAEAVVDGPALWSRSEESGHSTMHTGTETADGCRRPSRVGMWSGWSLWRRREAQGVANESVSDEEQGRLPLDMVGIPLAVLRNVPYGAAFQLTVRSATPPTQ